MTPSRTNQREKAKKSEQTETGFGYGPQRVTQLNGPKKMNVGPE